MPSPTNPIAALLEATICPLCGGPLVRLGPKCLWLHHPSMDEECYLNPVAEPKRDDTGATLPLLTKVIQ